MSRDNWEKLVGAVLRREKDRQLAYCESFSSLGSADVSLRPSSASDVLAVSRSPLQKFDPSNPSSQSIFVFRNVMAIEYKEIKKTTKNFQPELLLGDGVFGPVYKGWLHEHYLTAVKPGSGIAVAVKKLNKEGSQEHNQWMNEIHYLSQIHHPNMVKLIGYGFDTVDRIVVYEFVPKESLSNHLFTSRHHSLPWATRMKVAVGAAKALAFLHGLEIPVIHRNIKSSNILLDGDFNPKLSDFGHAIDGPTGDMTHVEPLVIGTIGYAAPEYMKTGHLTTRCDVYNFGVVLVELITGLRAFDNTRLSRQHNLIYWVRNNKKLLQIMDSRLDGQYPLKEAYKVAEIGLQCASSDPKLRPRMNEVVAALEKL